MLLCACAHRQCDQGSYESFCSEHCVVPAWGEPPVITSLPLCLSPLSLSASSHQAQTTCWDHPKMTELYQALGMAAKLPLSFFIFSPLHWGRVISTASPCPLLIWNTSHTPETTASLQLTWRQPFSGSVIALQDLN